MWWSPGACSIAYMFPPPWVLLFYNIYVALPPQVLRTLDVVEPWTLVVDDPSGFSVFRDMSRVVEESIPADIPEEESILGRVLGDATAEEQSILGDIQEIEEASEGGAV